MRVAIRASIAVAAAFAAAPACAQGFATKDLTMVAPAAVAALGVGFSVKAEPRRLTFVCDTCAGEPIVDVLLGRQGDGTEDRVRSGATTVADLERLCRARSPTCRMAALDVAPAVGWVSAYPLGGTAGATAIVLRSGDLLTIRSLATDPATARRAIDRLLPVFRARIVGR